MSWHNHQKVGKCEKYYLHHKDRMVWATFYSSIFRKKSGQTLTRNAKTTFTLPITKRRFSLPGIVLPSHRVTNSDNAGLPKKEAVTPWQKPRSCAAINLWRKRRKVKSEQNRFFNRSSRSEMNLELSSNFPGPGNLFTRIWFQAE